MIVKAVKVSFESAPREVLDAGWSTECLPNISKEKGYDVHAIVVFQSIIHFQIVEDLGGISWLPSFLFEVVDRSIPQDWECNLVTSDCLVVGPRYVCESRESYEKMVEMEPDQMEKFWERARRLKIRGTDVP